MKKIRKILGMLLIFDLLLVFSFALLAELQVNKINALKQADAVVVFFDDFKGETGLSAETKKRLADAEKVYKRGTVDKVICLGGHRSHPPREGSLLMASYLENQGVSAENILVDKASFSSKSNIDALNNIIESYKLRNVIFVSSPMHLLRLKLLFRKNVQTYASIRLSKIDHYELILAAHHEFASLFLNFIFPESIEKGLVKLVRNPV